MKTQEQLKDEVIQAAREYYSASETIISELGTDNTTEDDFANQAIADNSLAVALKALDAATKAKPGDAPYTNCCGMDPATCDCVKPDHGKQNH